MEKAKKAVSNFLSKDGKHDTTIDQDVRDPVVKEQVRPQRHEEVITAVDQEIHQDHHQTVVQPLAVKETLPEKHTHNMMAVNEKNVNHANAAETKAALQQDAGRYSSERNVADTDAPHHHVHHHVQPVIQKETIQPEVVHTTVPVHEVHQAAPIHHETTILPVKTMDEFLGTDAKELKASTPRQIASFDGCPNLKDKALKDEQDAIHGVNKSKTKVTPASNGLDHTTNPAKMMVNGTS
ncbi:hypothetical protein NLG97_g6455 [Lecanicillium saksenae]|uniref:Uncharacterized protein n=1 Tax=Lecanicillium saksenae TaxID=468837 RepID=A0ACC1QRF8_9HYPO|nr:hypothetical protein NLG97_g6455 [Lecanicillium saksenae]